MSDARVLPIHLRNVIDEDGVERPLEPLVHCPRRGATTDAKTCLGCARMRTVEWDPKAGGGEVRCMVEDATAPIRARADFAEIAARTQLHEVATRVTMCVRAGATLAQVRDLFVARGLRCAAVIDADARLEGVISRFDLVGASPDATVRDVMPERVRALPESAPVAYAIALMASEGVSEVPVVTERGELVGMWTALEALAWVSERIGYVKTPR